ncbi:MAG: gluconate 2-dehydrogenase subunit 3 family protein [Henriciella sp.]
MTDLIFDRRNMFKSLLAISAASALAACGGAEVSPSESSSDGPAERAETGGFFGPEELALISALADTIIPATDTAGAVAAGVPDTVQSLATDWGDDAFRTYWRNGLTALGSALNTHVGGDFVSADEDQRLAALTAHDAGVFDGDIQDRFYRDFKATVVQAYYMSEPGATEELAYEPVPGEWIGCVPLADFPKTWAT